MNRDDSPSPPQLDFVLEIRAGIGPTLELGASPAGMRRTIPITGGTFAGPNISGRILPGGADWQFVEPDGLTFLDAHYALETTDGVCIEVRNRGIRHGSPAVLARIAADDPVSPHEYYFRTTPRFYPPAGQYDWLKRAIFVGLCERYTNSVIVRVWKLD